MLINDYYHAQKIIFYSEQIEEKKPLNPYQAKAFFNSVDIFGDDIEMSDDNFNIFVKELVPCCNNPQHINAKKRKNAVFIVLERGTLQGVLYIPFNKVKAHEVIEDKKDYQGRGCVCVCYNDKIIFDDSIKVYAKDSRSYFSKGSDPIPQGVRYECENLREKVEELEKKKSYFINEKATQRLERLKALYLQKIDDGFDHITFEYKYKTLEADYIVLYGFVDHYEKSPEYLKLERLTNELKTICDRWDESDTVELLKRYKLTKKRTSKKGNN